MKVKKRVLTLGEEISTRCEVGKNAYPVLLLLTSRAYSASALVIITTPGSYICIFLLVLRDMVRERDDTDRPTRKLCKDVQ